MRKIILGLAATAMLVSPLAIAGSASADKPDGSFVFKGNANSNGSIIGVLSSQIKQNGQFVSGQVEAYDQTTTPGSRAAIVQELLGH